MPDMSTRLAALRTGKIDYMGNTGDVNIYSIDDLETLLLRCAPKGGVREYRLR